MSDVGSPFPIKNIRSNCEIHNKTWIRIMSELVSMTTQEYLPASTNLEDDFRLFERV
jgi:hypothetical protein